MPTVTCVPLIKSPTRTCMGGKSYYTANTKKPRPAEQDGVLFNIKLDDDLTDLTLRVILLRSAYGVFGWFLRNIANHMYPRVVKDR